MKGAALLLLGLLAGCTASPVRGLSLGRPYLVIWTYGPGPRGPVGYREVLIFDRWGRHGWAYGHNPGDETVWAMRLSNALAVTPYVPAERPTVPPEIYRSSR